jgi:hypothetical protein
VQIDAVALHGHALLHQESPLASALREAPVGPDDAVPREVSAGRSEDEADVARGAGIDVAIGAHKSGRDGAHAADDPRRSLFRAGHVYIVT